MNPQKLPIDLTAKEFQAIVKSVCRRWSTSSIDAMRYLLVQKVGASAAAKKADITVHTVNILATRFEAKIRAYRLLEFKNSNPPQGAALSDFRQEIETLMRESYTPAQIIKYLEDNGLKTTVDELSDYTKELFA